MGSSFIANIKIDNFKCFNDFEVDGIKRINLIGGRNNMGKTTLMEACLLATSSNINLIYQNLLLIQTARDIINILANNESSDESIKKLIDQKDFKIISGNEAVSYRTEDYKYHIQCLGEKYDKTYSELHNILQVTFPHKYYLASSFLSINIIHNGLSKMLINKLKKLNQYDELNNHLKKIFDIYNIDIIDDELNIKKTKEDIYAPLSSYGQGFKSFINILLGLLINKEHMFIDEIENGIHYTLYDKLWEIIFKISKDKDMQIFVTTHSKECIESYCRVSKKLKENDISFINLSKNKKNESIAITLDNEMLISEMEQNHEIRAW